MRRASGWENIPSIAATTTCFSVRETQRDKFRVLPSLRSFAQVRIVPQSMASATGSSTLRQVSFSRILCTFLTLLPPPGRYLRLREESGTPSDAGTAEPTIPASEEDDAVRASLPHLFCPFANIERSSPEASVCSDVSNVACVNWRPPRGKGCTF